VFRALRFTEGWPVVALYLQRLVHERVIDTQSEAIPDRLLTELFDYVDAQVIGSLPAPLFRTLAAAAGWTDLTDADVDGLFGPRGAVADLIGVHQVAQPGAHDRIHLHPVIRRTILRRHRPQVNVAMRMVAERFLALARYARAAECYLAAGDAEAAADCALQLDDGFVTLTGTRPVITENDDDRAELAADPEIRLALVSAQRLLEPARNLPREALAVLDAIRGERPALDKAALGVAVLTLLDAGRTAEAGALVDEARPSFADVTTGADLVLLAAQLALFAQLGRFDEGMRLWQPLRRRVFGSPVWVSQLIRFEVQAARARGRWEVEHDALTRMVAQARTGRAIPFIAVALAEAVFGAWLAGENESCEAYRTELKSLVERYDVPALLRFTLAANGSAPRVGSTNVPLWDARAFLLAAADAPDGGSAAQYARAGLEAADAAGEPLTKVLARVCAAEKLGSPRVRLREALELCTVLDASPLADSVSALAEYGDARGMLAPFVNRMRHRSSVVVTAGDVPLSISLADGTVSRGEERVDVSEGVLALLTALAVESHPVGRERLIDRVWPDLQDESAYNALKMCVHRARQQLGDPGAIVASRGGYALAPAICVDVRWLQRELDRIRRDAVPNGDVPALEEVFERLAVGRPASYANWEWFEPIEQTLEAATREVGMFLAERALRAADHVRALAIAQTLTKLDPLDEGARGIAIRAHLAANDRGAAILEFRGYKSLLRAELDVEPSAELKRLLEAS
jgi:DNA-binding SARP family transcriptional activator